MPEKDVAKATSFYSQMVSSGDIFRDEIYSRKIEVFKKILILSERILLIQGTRKQLSSKPSTGATATRSGGASSKGTMLTNILKLRRKTRKIHKVVDLVDKVDKTTIRLVRIYIYDIG